MQSQPIDTGPNGTDSELSARTAFELLSNDRRRLAARVLSGCLEAVTLEELATAIADRDGTPAPGRIADLRVELHHCHLPKLVDAGLVRYDRETNRLQPLPALSRFVSAFDLEGSDAARPEC